MDNSINTTNLDNTKLNPTDILKEYEKLKRDYETLVEANERLRPTSENHHMALNIHPYCDRCLRFKPVVKKYIDISVENIDIFYDNMRISPTYNVREKVEGNTIVSCEHHDTCSMMYDYIYNHLRKE